MRKKAEQLMKLLEAREEVEKIDCVIVDDFRKTIKIHYLLTKEYGDSHNLDFLTRVFEYNPEIRNLSHTREYAYTK